MTLTLAQSKAGWAEDTALQAPPSGGARNRSADPGAKTGGGVKPLRSIPLLSHTLRDWHPSEKPSQHEAAKSLTGRCLQFTNTNPPEFQFPLNQDTRSFLATLLRGEGDLQSQCC